MPYLIMPYLLLFSLLAISQAQENFTQELNEDLAAAFQNLEMDQNESIDLAEPDSFDLFIADAEQEFNRAASLSYEDIQWILEQAREEFLKRNK